MFIKNGIRYALVSAPSSIQFSANSPVDNFLTQNSILVNQFVPRVPTEFTNSSNRNNDSLPFCFETLPTKKEDIALVSLNFSNRMLNLCKDSTLRTINQRLRRSQLDFAELYEQHPNFITEYEQSNRYYNRRIALNTEMIDYYPVQVMQIKHKTDNYISPYSETVINNFSPSDNGGFVELNIDTTSFTRDIAANMLLNNHFTHYDSQPSRKYQSTYQSRTTIDSFNEFSYISDSFKDQLIEAIGVRKIKAFEIENFYRGSTPARASITEVRSNKIVKGNFVFPVIINFNILNQETLEYEPKKILVFALFRSWERVIRYSKSREFITALLEDLSYADGLKFFDPEAYERQMKELYGAHVEYWSGITSIWKGDWNRALKPLESICDTTVNATHMANSFGYEAIKNSSETIEFQEIDKAYKAIEEKVSAATTQIENTTREISALQRQKEDLERRIETQERYITTYQTNLDKSVKDLNAATVAKSSIYNEYTKAKETYQTYVSGIENDYDGALNWLNNIHKTGIVIENICYRSTTDYEYKSILEDPSLPVKAIQSKVWKLHSINFRTTKPVIIYVDRGSRGEACQKIVGGPYNIKVTQTEIMIALQSSKSCFGNDGSKLWVHPHTSYLSIATDSTWQNFTASFVGNSVRGCLGEASPILFNAFENNDIKTAIFGAMTWVTSANSTDTWGKNYKYFPKISEVNLNFSNSSETEEKEEIELTEEGVEAIVESLAMMVEEEYPEPAPSTNIVDQILELDESNNEPDVINPVETGIWLGGQRVHPGPTADRRLQRLLENPPTPAELLGIDEDLVLAYRNLTNQAPQPAVPDEPAEEDLPNLRHAGIRGYRPYGT